MLRALATREASDKIDWSKTWIAEMFLSEGERKRREEELERLRGITPEVKRYNEIKAGVITGSIGIGVTVFLYVFMQGIILGGKVPPDTAEILSRVWVAGVVPLMVGLALIINGMFVSKKLVEATRQRPTVEPNVLGNETEPPVLRSADTTEFLPPEFSVTEDRTRQFSNAGQKPQGPNNV